MELYIRKIPGSIASEITLISQGDNLRGSVWAYWVIEKGHLVPQNFILPTERSLAETKPLFVIEEKDLRELTQVFVDFSKQMGIEPTTESKAKGMLEAQTKHLSDLRQILKLK